MDVITTHLHADFVGLASEVAAQKLSGGRTLVLPGGAQETPRRFLRQAALGFVPATSVARSTMERLILVDTQDPQCSPVGRCPRAPAGR
jgi:tRNA nucleotidyltransferase (CCA-adding enzyme)